VIDLVGEPAPTPGVLALEGAAVALDELPRARDDLVLPLIWQLGVEQQHDFVVDHVPLASFGLVGLAASCEGRSGTRRPWAGQGRATL